MARRAKPHPAIADSKEVRRFNMNLPPQTYAELMALAELRHCSMTEIVRLALGIVRIVVPEIVAGNKLVIATKDDRPVKEIVLP